MVRPKTNMQKGAILILPKYLFLVLLSDFDWFDPNYCKANRSSCNVDYRSDLHEAETTICVCMVSICMYKD